MLMFTLAISCLTTSNLPWFMDLTFQVPMQYCSLQHRTLLTSPVTSTTGCCFCFGSTSSFCLELFLHWSPVTYWVPGEFIFQCSISLPFHTVHALLKERILKWFAIPFSSGPRFARTLTRLSWVVLHGMAHSFTELDKSVVHVISLVSFLWLWFSFCLPSDGEGRETFGSFLMGETNRWRETWKTRGPSLAKIWSRVFSCTL